MPEKQTPGVSEERRCGSGKKTSKSFQTLQTSHHNNIIHNFGFAYIIYKYLYIYIYIRYIIIYVSMYPKTPNFSQFCLGPKCRGPWHRTFVRPLHRSLQCPPTPSGRYATVSEASNRGPAQGLTGLRVILRFGQIGIPTDFSNEAKF